MQTKAGLLACVLIATACGQSEEHNDPTDVKAVRVKVSGNVAVLPVPPLAAASDFTQLTVNVLNPASLMLNPTRVSPLASAALDTAHPACSMLACPFAVPEVNIRNTSMGLVAQVQGAPNIWAPAYTGFVSPEVSKKAAAAAQPIEQSMAYAVSTASLKTLATSLDLTSEQLVARGLLIGIASAPQRTASADTLGVPAPVQGVTVASSGPKAGNVRVYFPSEDFSQVTTDGATNSAGVFLVVGEQAGALPFTLTLNMVDPTGANTWSPQMAGMGPGFTLITVYPST